MILSLETVLNILLSVQQRKSLRKQPNMTKGKFLDILCCVVVIAIAICTILYAVCMALDVNEQSM